MSFFYIPSSGRRDIPGLGHRSRENKYSREMNENRATTSPPQSSESGDFDEDTDDDDFLEPDDDDDDVRVTFG